MTERLAEPTSPRTTNPPVEPTPELARKNITLGIALFLLALLIAGGAVGVSFIYLHFD
jgi:hypothetical protein